MLNFSTKFVCEDTERSTYEKNIPAPLFRKSFVLDNDADSAEILICGLGFYTLFINGKNITKGYLAPYISNSDHITYFDKYDIKDYLQKGENVIGVMLGDGHQNRKTSTWDFKDNITNSAPLLALTAEIISDDKTITFEADDFVCKKVLLSLTTYAQVCFTMHALKKTAGANPDLRKKIGTSLL